MGNDGANITDTAQHEKDFELFGIQKEDYPHYVDPNQFAQTFTICTLETHIPTVAMDCTDCITKPSDKNA